MRLECTVLVEANLFARRSSAASEFALRDHVLLDRPFGAHDIAAVLHFAGLKSVGESVREPLAYYENNVSAP